MRVADVSFYYDEYINTEEELLQQHYTTVGWAEALQRKGVDMIVIKRFHRNNFFVKNGVQYYFMKDALGGTLKSWQLPYSFLKRIVAFNPDIVHVHTFPCSLPVFLLRFLLKQKSGIVIQNHGGKVAGGIRVLLYKYMSYIADAFFFTAAAQGRHWFKNKRLLKKVMPVMEGGTFFNLETWDRDRIIAYTDRGDARLQSGMKGHPVFLWVGRLDENKDPLTILDGFEVLFKTYTDASLYMIYSDDDLLNNVQQKITGSTILKDKVYLLGKIPHESMMLYYNSADYFVLGSHYEGSGFALNEALSCGCVPVITDIPSFRMMTDNGRLGALWQVGNKNSFVDAVNNVVQKPLLYEANDCIKFFKNNLSFDGIAVIAMLHYQKIITARNNNR
jgi:glycosyltransferase involved in cell wall biosynthesis